MLLPLLAIFIVLVCLAIGWRDLVRFRPRRVMAIAGVCVTESVRRRVLWITPLAIVGVIAVSQLSHPSGELDAIRQTIKYCLFASGLIVIVAAVILACTNLPKEIDNRVIYTIVTKPTTRLEIVLGKVIGFAGVSGLILLIMGLFTYGYLETRALAMQKRIRSELEARTVDPTMRITYQHYSDAGLLSTKALAWPEALEIFSRIPALHGPKWIAGGRNQFYVVPFNLSAADQQQIEAMAQKNVAFFLITSPLIERREPTPEEEQELKSGSFPFDRPSDLLVAGPQLPSTRPTSGPSETRTPIPQVAIMVSDPGLNNVTIDDVTGKNFMPPPPVPGSAATERQTFAAELNGKAMTALLETGRSVGKDGSAKFYVEVSAVTPTFDYGADSDTTYIAALQPIIRNAPAPPPPAARGAQGPSISPPAVPQTIAAPQAGEYRLYDLKNSRFVGDPVTLAGGEALGFAPTDSTRINAVAGARRFLLPRGSYLWMQTVKTIRPAFHDLMQAASYAKDGQPAPAIAPPKFYSRIGRSGMQIGGQPPATQPTSQPTAQPASGSHTGVDAGGSVAVYRFDHIDLDAAGASDKVGLQLHIYVDRGGDLDAEGNSVSVASVQVRNRATGAISPPIQFEPETSRFNYIDVPSEYLRGGDFDVMLRGLTTGQWLGVQGPAAETPSVAVITANRSFTGNLFKSLLILWMLSVLVIVIAVFCSTFLSWPIAIVLTMLLLLGHWGVDQLGDALAPGAARSIGADIFGVRDPTRTRAVTAGMEALSAMLRAAAQFLPNVAKFPVSEDIARGVSIPVSKLLEAGGQLALFGFPLLALTYVILRNKEVAP